MLNRKHHHKVYCITVTINNGGKCLHMKTRQIVGFPKQSSLAFGKYPISDFHENAHYWNYLPILSITPLALFYAKGKFHLKMKKKNACRYWWVHQQCKRLSQFSFMYKHCRILQLFMQPSLYRKWKNMQAGGR